MGTHAERADIEDVALAAPLPVGAGLVPVRRFLLDCADSAGGTLTDEQRVFLRAGRQALLTGSGWVQYGLSLAGCRPAPSLYAALGDLATTVLHGGQATQFAFVHKPPGLRIRFEPAPGERDELRGQVRAACERWQRDNLVGTVTEPCYEPETALFGGPASLTHVHRLFTTDSLFWLECHAAPGEPAWARSLPVLAELFAGLGVVGWEDLDVWDRVRVQCRRGLPSEVTGSAAFRHAADGVRAAWAQSRESAGHLGVRALADTWRREYLDTGEAWLGPREAAALVTIFHWNRGGLDPLRQGLLTEALADRAAALGIPAVRS
ncbi:thiopeptide-type bacteriocin biosynthesis protein [Kibdelosporangium persicum]|uniref:O-methyltransferase clustered with LanBC n=1 Tax=Kibdelosporangium persicum TaxID=2698649 RepID=A0ABX2FGA6_9PSEU|nr:thiopeptide-type bacteriocin biosynthesis protein [Kibdelosporangium persicum]NRN70405.1 O-methyltransferase clustered with LanBC [Kibdelosporangium persicum]